MEFLDRFEAVIEIGMRVVARLTFRNVSMTSRAPSRLVLWLKELKFSTGVVDLLLLVDTALPRIDIRGPGRQLEV
jgi:hypothetical protein